MLHLFVCWRQMCIIRRGRTSRGSLSSPPPLGTQELSSGHQPWWQEALSLKPSRRPEVVIFKSRKAKQSENDKRFTKISGGLLGKTVPFRWLLWQLSASSLSASGCHPDTTLPTHDPRALLKWRLWKCAKLFIDI